MIGRSPELFHGNHSTAKRKEWVPAKRMMEGASLMVDLIRVHAFFQDQFIWEIEALDFQWGLLNREFTLKQSGFGCYEGIYFVVEGPQIKTGFDVDPSEGHAPGNRIHRWILGEGTVT